MDLHKIIHSALHEFIQAYIPDADPSTLDDVLLSYITGVLEDLGSQMSVEENFDLPVPEWESQEQHLLEMFPKCSLSEARSALSIAKGDMEEAPPKKLVRYHSNQVVTTKGERYQLVKKDEAEDMKKTYVSLKPSRKYRFH
ncbi:CUE domain-containing protein 2 [Liparis tanakae]|uniref:CUE domain-containing protein 2 n=1 Tax=Liparis tanakae TaxID=230148 RepID=A0A4Z2ISD8_9TELE|nr:CUE domain-containing protein 2 [Liparis tanakae]